MSLGVWCVCVRAGRGCSRLGFYFFYHPALTMNEYAYDACESIRSSGRVFRGSGRYCIGRWTLFEPDITSTRVRVAPFGPVADAHPRLHGQ